MKYINHCLLLLLIFASSCVTSRSYIMSPMDINTSPYQTVPNTVDSQKAATYVSVALNGGGSNQTLKDGVFGGRAALSRAYRFGNFQAYYGGGINLGNYSLKNADHDYGFSDTVFHYRGSNKFYGMYGFSAGINLVIPFGNGRGEWRVLGVEGSYQKEFGDYVRFRKQLADSVTDILASYGQIFKLGGSTELVGVSRHGTEIGYKVALGTILMPRGSYEGISSDFKPYYMSHALHVTKKNVTGFIQFNIGAHAMSFQFGMNYNLSKKRE